MRHLCLSPLVKYHTSKVTEQGPFSKAPLNTGPDNLPGRLMGNFSGPTRNRVSRSTSKLFPYLSGPIKIAVCYQSLTRASRSSAREGERLWTTPEASQPYLFDTFDFSESRVIVAPLRLSLCQRWKGTERDRRLGHTICK